MEAKKNEFAQTNSALSELSEALAKLNVAVSTKRNELKVSAQAQEELLKDRESRLKILQTSSQNILHNIDNIIGKLDKVLEEDVTSNNNN